MQETKYLSGREYAALLSLFAAVSHYAELFPRLRNRAELIPGLWEKMEDAHHLTDEILEEIVRTIPQDKCKHMLADIKHVKLYVKIEPPGSVPSVKMDGFSYVPTPALNELLAYVMEHECMMCDKTPVEARKCPIRNTFKGALVHEVDAQDGEHCKYSDMIMNLDD